MINSITDTILNLWISGRKTRKSPSGWISGNAVCCQYRGETADTRGRGGILLTSNNQISYSCFNCQFKTGYRPGQHLGYKFRRLLAWLGADENTVNRLVIEAVRIREYTGSAQVEPEPVEIAFKPRALPDPVYLVDQDPVALKYCQDRGIDLNKYPVLATDRTEHNLNRRVIIPFTWQNQLIGYTARAWDSQVRPKYHSQYEPNYVFNMDQQRADSEFVIVCEGPFDAMSIDGVAVLSNDCSETQADIIDTLGREVVLVPDQDRAGQQLIRRAQEYGWSVSFPIWAETSKDINEAVLRYGRLFVLKSILDSRETSRLKIELLRKRLN